LVATGSGRKTDTETSLTLDKVVVMVSGEAEWAAIQTVHVAESSALEC